MAPRPRGAHPWFWGAPGPPGLSLTPPTAGSAGLPTSLRCPCPCPQRRPQTTATPWAASQSRPPQGWGPASRHHRPLRPLEAQGRPAAALQRAPGLQHRGPQGGADSCGLSTRHPGSSPGARCAFAPGAWGSAWAVGTDSREGQGQQAEPALAPGAREGGPGIRKDLGHGGGGGSQEPLRLPRASCEVSRDHCSSVHPQTPAKHRAVSGSSGLQSP